MSNSKVSSNSSLIDFFTHLRASYMTSAAIRNLGVLRTVAVLLAVAVHSTLAHDAPAQDNFQRLSGQHLDLITDLPLDDSLRELPEVFDAAVPEWCRFFGVDPAETKQWRAQVCIMLDRQRFKTAGLLPDNLPEFPHGYQWDDDLWVVEQPTQYYRRHLLLHEGTHWFMFRQFGSAGPPWLMEGTAEWLATHRWIDGKLTLGIIPHSHDDVPMWGRITKIQQQLNDGLAPSLETILRYDNRAHQSTDAYAWSWAAVIFLHNHPSTKKAFGQLLNGQLKNDATPTKQILRALQPRKQLVRAEWSAMLTGLEYGFVPDRELVQLDHRTAPLVEPKEVKIMAAKGWQTTGIAVTTGQKFDIRATGRYVVGKQPKPWECEPDGVTIRYHQGQPLGKLLLAIAEPQASEPDFSEPLTITPVGAQAQVTALGSGQILLRINETGAGLDDNSGELSVRLSNVP
ncbi:MAG: hypothetical protein IT423_04785 [Pirellulaceae bacterium]|nr:hypothetical protein [Pirellulaceae bacterium]